MLRQDSNPGPLEHESKVLPRSYNDELSYKIDFLKIYPMRMWQKLGEPPENPRKSHPYELCGLTYYV